MSLYYENELLHVIEKCIRCFKKWKCFGDSQHIKTMLKSEENEVLALYGGGRNMLSQKYKNWYASVWPSWFSRNVRGIHKEFMGCSTKVEQRFIKPVNAGRKSVYQQKMQLQSEVNTIFHLFILAFPSSSPPRGVFRTQSNICDEEFFAKIVNG